MQKLANEASVLLPLPNFSPEMSQFIYRQRAFLVPFVLLWLSVGYLEFFYSQNYIILAINHHWTPEQDTFFAAMTNLGDGYFVILAALIALYFSYQRGTLILAGYALSGIIVQISKTFIFPDSHRPAFVMSHVLPWLHTVADVRMYQNSSFPSGHTTSAFALFAMLAFFSRSPLVKFLCILPAVGVAYSRMYLLQHFLLDVHVGSVLGTGTAVLLVYYLPRWWEAHPRAWHQKGLRNWLAKKQD